MLAAAFLLLLSGSVHSVEVLERWANNLVEVVRTAQPLPGGEVVVGARFLGVQGVTRCTVEGGTGELYTLEGGRLLGEPEGVTAIEGWEEGDCVLSLAQHLLAPSQTVRLALQLGTGGLLGQLHLTEVVVIVHMEDKLLTSITDPEANNQPSHYKIRLEPELLDNSSNIMFRGSVEVEMRVGPGSRGLDIQLHSDGLQVWTHHRPYHPMEISSPLLQAGL